MFLPETFSGVVLAYKIVGNEVFKTKSSTVQIKEPGHYHLYL
jgi:hypothetical protein